MGSIATSIRFLDILDAFIGNAEDRMHNIKQIRRYESGELWIDCTHQFHLLSRGRLQEIFQSQYLINPSNPAVATLLVSCGCHLAQHTGPSLATILLHSAQLFQSQKHTYPPLSPLIKNCPSGLMSMSMAYPALLWPRYIFLRFWRNLSVAA